MPFLVEWWERTLYHEHEGRVIEHAQRLVFPAILAMYNRPQAVINLQALHDRVHELVKR